MIVQLISATVLSPGTVAADSWRPTSGLGLERRTEWVDLLLDSQKVLLCLRRVRGLAELSTERLGMAREFLGQFPNED